MDVELPKLDPATGLLDPETLAEIRRLRPDELKSGLTEYTVTEKHVQDGISVLRRLLTKQESLRQKWGRGKNADVMLRRQDETLALNRRRLQELEGNLQYIRAVKHELGARMRETEQRNRAK